MLALGMVVDPGQEALERHPVVQVLARVNFVGDIDALFLERVEDRPPALAEFVLGQHRPQQRPVALRPTRESPHRRL